MVTVDDWYDPGWSFVQRLPPCQRRQDSCENVGGMTEIICHGAGRKALKPKEAERCENMDGVKDLKILIWLKWRLN